MFQIEDDNFNGYNISEYMVSSMRDSDIFGGDIISGIDIAEDIIDKSENEGQCNSEELIHNLLEIYDILFSPNNSVAWKEINNHSMRFLKTSSILTNVDRIGIDCILDPFAPYELNHISVKTSMANENQSSICYSFSNGSICLSDSIISSLEGEGKLEQELLGS